MKNNMKKSHNRVIAYAISIIMIATSFSCATVFAESDIDTNSVNEVESQIEATDYVDGMLEQQPQIEMPVQASINGGKALKQVSTNTYFVDMGYISSPFEEKAFTIEIVYPQGCVINEEDIVAEEVEGRYRDPETGEYTDFLTIDSSSTEIIDPDVTNPDAVALQKTTINAKLVSTGQASLTIAIEGDDTYLDTTKVISFKQERRTTIMSRSAKVNKKYAKLSKFKRSYVVKYKYKKKTAYKTVYKDFELRGRSGQSSKKYSRMQGGATDGTYGYYSLARVKSNYYAKISKVRLSDGKVVKVSSGLKINHVNDITYDPENVRLVITHNMIKRKRVSFVDPNTLKVIGYHDIVVPTKLKGASSLQLQKIGGFASVTYMNGGTYAGKYVAVISYYHNFLILDENFVPIEYVDVSAIYNNNSVYYQGVDAVDDTLLISVYPKSKKYYNMICEYNVVTGDYLGNINLRKGYEVENVFHSGETFYAGFYKKSKRKGYIYRFKNILFN